MISIIRVCHCLLYLVVAAESSITCAQESSVQASSGAINPELCDDSSIAVHMIQRESSRVGRTRATSTKTSALDSPLLQNIDKPTVLTESGSLYYDSECSIPFSDAEDWFKNNGRFQFVIGDCTFNENESVYERYTCGKEAGVMVETIFDNAECEGIPLYPPISLQNHGCTTDPLHSYYFKILFSGGCGV